MVLRPVARRKEPFRQFVETPDCRTLGTRRVSPRSTPTGSNFLSLLSAGVKRELTKKKRISTRKRRAKCAVKKEKVSREERREIRRKRKRRQDGKRKKRRRAKKEKSGI